MTYIYAHAHAKTIACVCCVRVRVRVCVCNAYLKIFQCAVPEPNPYQVEVEGRYSDFIKKEGETAFADDEAAAYNAHGVIKQQRCFCPTHTHTNTHKHTQTHTDM